MNSNASEFVGWSQAVAWSSWTIFTIFYLYIDNRAAEGQCDGLEVWLVSLVMGCSIDVVQDDSI